MIVLSVIVYIFAAVGVVTLARQIPSPFLLSHRVRFVRHMRRVVSLELETGLGLSSWSKEWLMNLRPQPLFNRSYDMIATFRCQLCTKHFPRHGVPVKACVFCPDCRYKLKDMVDIPELTHQSILDKPYKRLRK